MSQNIEPIAQEWLNSGFKGLLIALLSIGVYVFNSNSTSLSHAIEELTTELRVVQANQIKTNEKVQAIEVSRAASIPGYEKLQSEVQDIKTQVIQIVARQQTLADFVVGNSKKLK